MKSNTFKYILIACACVYLLSGCAPKAPVITPSQEEKDPIVIGEDPPKVETTDTVIIGDETPEVQEKPLDKPDDSKSETPASNTVQAEILDDWTWKRDDNLTIIEGSVLNSGTKPIGFFRVKAEYVDKDGNVVETDSAVHGEVVWPGHQKKFKISNIYANKHETVRIWVDEVVKAKEPVIYKSPGTNAEIVEGWTWRTDGQFSYIEGVIRNTGEKNIRYYKIMAEYADGSEQVLDSTYTNSNESFEPGQEQNFKIMHPHSSDYLNVTIYISNMN